MAGRSYKSLPAWLLFIGVSAAPGAFAASSDGDDAGEATMMVVEEGATPENIVNIIELPRRASATARENRMRDTTAADDARQWGGQFGQQAAEEAKSKGLGEQIRDDMQQDRGRDVRGDNGQGHRPNGN